MTAIMMPDLRQANPYQRLLGEALAREGVEVVFPQGYRLGLPLTRAYWEHRPARILHLHWIEPYLIATGPLPYAWKGLRLWADLILLRLWGVRLIWTIHNSGAHEARHPAIERWIQNGVARLADALIVHSESAAREMSERLSLPIGRFHVVEHGDYGGTYGPPVEMEEAKRSLGLPAGSFVFLHFGNIRPYKGLEDLLAVWGKHAARNEDSWLLIAGHSASPEYSRQLAGQVAALPRVRWDAGIVPDGKVSSYYSACAAVVLPFRQILTSGSLLLALTYAKPVLGPALPFLRETLSGCEDFLYRPGSEEELGKALDSAAQALRGNSGDMPGRLRNLSARHDWNLLAGKLRGIYQAVCGSRAGDSGVDSAAPSTKEKSLHNG